MMATPAGGLSAIPKRTASSGSRLQLPTQDIPRMPFSSPITEEITSPLSPVEHCGALESPTQGHSDPFASPLPSQDPFLDYGNDGVQIPYTSELKRYEDREPEVETMSHVPQETSNSWAYQASRAAARSASTTHSRRYSVGKLGREASRRRQQPSRARRPGITVITNFSQHRRTPSATEMLLAKRSMTFPQDLPVGGAPISAECTPRAPTSPPRRHEPIVTPVHQRPPPPVGFVSLADLKALDDQAEPRKGFKWPRMGKEPKTQSKARPSREGQTAGESKMLSNREIARVKDAHFKTNGQRPNRQPYNEIDDPQKGSSTDPRKQIMEGGNVMDSPENALSLGFEDGGETRNRLRPPPIKLGDDLSPSDRPIVIGLSIPSARLEEHTLRPLSASGAGSAITAQATRARAPSDANSVTPTIIITPARESSGFSMFPRAPSPPSTRRIASSIYSQPTPHLGGAARAREIPPMPALPAKTHHNRHEASPFTPKRQEVRDSANTLFEEDEDEKSPLRSLRSQSATESDQSPQVTFRGRSFSDTSALSPGNRSSIDTTATRHRSRGWWNFITTPFVTRSNTALANRQSHANHRQEVPSLARAAGKLRDHDEREEKVWDKQFSPVSAKSKSGHTTMWTDLDWWEEDREKIGIAVDHTPRASVSNHQSKHKAQDSSATIPFVMADGLAGAAAAVEYHDRNHQALGSNNPFNQDRSPQQDAQVQSEVPEPRQSQFSSFSPNDREVPMLFEGDHYAVVGHNPTNPFYQAPSDPFASSFRQVAPPTPRPRPDSGMTEIEAEDEVTVSPTVHEARVAPVLVARPPILASRHVSSSPVDSNQRGEQQPDLESTAPPPYSPPRRAEYRPYVAVYPPAPQNMVYQQPLSPGPISPGMQRAMSSRVGIPMAEVAMDPAPAAARRAYITNNYYARHQDLPPRPKAAPVTLADLETPADMRQRAEARRKRREKEDALAARVGGLWRGRGCFSANGCAGRGGAEGRKRRRWCCCITFGLIVMITIIIVLAMTLHRRGDNTPVQTQWLNTTGFPPMPTGISTIAQPDAVVENTGCVHPSTMWSCALPKEQQQSVAPNAPNQPNFRLEIRFRNDSSTSNITSRRTPRHLAHNPVSARKLVRHRLLRARDVLTSTLWSPSPSPPTIEDQRFLGNTTDHVTSPLFEGEPTPFYMTFLPATPATSRLVKRLDASPTNKTADPFPDLASLIPPPSLNSDGTPKPATLLPLPGSQPLRLYDRGLQTEHYGFYNYFDRSIFLKSVRLVNDSNPGEVPADMNGGSTAGEAKVQCTWAQTRFLVKIWTRKGDSAQLLHNGTTTTTPKDIKEAKNTTILSANDFSRPGSFPYPVSIVLDRHGGALKEKMVYCYGLDERGKVVPKDKKFQIEERGFGGVPVNGADGPWGNVTISVGEGGPGGVDGGDGGCGCEWRNWVGG